MTENEIDVLNNEAWELRLYNLQESYSKSLNLVELSESKNYAKGIADSCKTLGYCYWRFSDYSLSLSHSLRALDIYRKLRDKLGEADTLNSVGAVYMFQNDNEKRLEVNLLCKKIRSEVGDLEGVASSEGNIGETYFEMGAYDEASKCFHNVLVDPNASPQGKSWAFHNLGRVANVRENFEEALAYYLKGLELSISVDYSVLTVEAYSHITELYIQLEQHDKAIDSAEKGLEASRRSGMKEGEKIALFHLSKIYEMMGLFEESLRYHKDYHTIDLEISRDKEIERLKTTQLKVAYDKIEEQKDQLVDSIKYAERIQTALLTRDQEHALLTHYFVLYQPKDIVSGDFYWYYEKDDHFYMAVADCTGHGVPGAFLTMLGTTFLNEIIALNEDATPAFILERLRFRIIRALSQSTSDDSTKDGMDISLLRFNVKTKEGEWAGAYNPLWVVRANDKPSFKTSGRLVERKGETHTLYEVKADKFPIGIMENMGEFSNHKVKFLEDDSVYIFSDGFADQFGGIRGKKYRTGKFKDTLLQIENVEIDNRGIALEKELQDWKKDLDQVDDVCVFGIKIFAPEP
jgi:tetratricopeptide (TPR) repeat protein